MSQTTRSFLFTDIASSTRLWEAHPEAMRADVARHDAIVRRAIVGRGGDVVKGTGDGVLAAFHTAVDAVLAAQDAQRALLAEPWRVPGGIRVRMGIHAGEAEWRDGDWYGTALNRAARLMSVANPGQTLLSAAAAMLARDGLPGEVRLVGLGTVPLKDLAEPEPVFQADGPGLPTSFPPIGPAPLVRLPESLTSFVGRDREIAELVELVGRSRLVTLFGPGGAGKTRLSVRVAVELADRFPDGAVFVDLAVLAEGARVADHTRDAFGLREEPAVSPTTTLVRHLRDRRVLVILDNCEHVVDDAARLADALGRGCPRVALLATSREALGVPGELLFPVPALAGEAATRLFVERAVAVAPGFALDATNAAAVDEIVRRLDGIPLAIELAAARVRSLSAPEIARRLDDRFALLTSGGRTLLPRQQTLRALIDWSYQLLPEGERVLFRRLSVFAGGGSLDAVTEVCGCGADAFDRVDALVSRSLLVAVPVGGATRYRQLDTIRAFGAEQLAAAGEGAGIRDAHLAWCLALCRQVEPALIGAGQREAFDRLAVEHDNLRAAIGRALETAPLAALELVKILFWFWQARGHASEGRALIDQALAHPGAQAPDPLRQGALVAAGSLAWVLGDYEAADRHLLAAAAVARGLGDGRAEAIALALLGQVRSFSGQYAAAKQALGDALAVAERVDDPYPRARALGSLADVARNEGDHDELLRIADQALAAFERIGMEEGMAFNLCYGAWALQDRDPAAALARLRRAHAGFVRIDHPFGQSFVLLTLAVVERLPPTEAALLLGAMAALDARAAFPHGPQDARRLERVRDQARLELGDAAFDAAFTEGRSLDAATFAAQVDRWLAQTRP